MSQASSSSSKSSLSLLSYVERVLSFEIQLIEFGEGPSVFTGRLFYSNAEIREDLSSRDYPFGDPKISVKGMAIDGHTKIVVKAENIHFVNFSSGDKNDVELNFDPDKTIHQEEMLMIPIGSDEHMTEQDDRYKTSSDSHFESCNTTSCRSNDTKGDTSLIVSKAVNQDVIQLDSKDSNKASSQSEENPTSYSSGSTTMNGDGCSTHSNAAEDSAEKDEIKPPTFLFLCNTLSNESNE